MSNLEQYADESVDALDRQNGHSYARVHNREVADRLQQMQKEGRLGDNIDRYMTLEELDIAS